MVPGGSMITKRVTNNDPNVVTSKKLMPELSDCGTSVAPPGPDGARADLGGRISRGRVGVRAGGRRQGRAEDPRRAPGGAPGRTPAGTRPGVGRPAGVGRW
ncbi:hypothetical protein GCM10018781_10240 [Kitasatospora indigofera]|uniref:Uncharacterized protein n=1 Tax=Kitasatospora indigofera TaxID=67307 RepID=A0A919KL67_9ACTN|nr:hypothetical protein GCM10018781_10240 [Kitasatospora indigofera]